MQLREKYLALKEYINNLGSLAVAFSGGVDSTFLLKVAHDVLGEKCIAVTARSSTYPLREFNEAYEFASQNGIKHIVVDSEELDIEGFAQNPINRCYFCKHELFSKIWDVADGLGIKNIADGSNIDDLGDFRPGMDAARDLHVVSPLKDCKLTKEDIRILSKELNLPTWDKPAFACLSSRFPYGNTITREKLYMVEHAEDYLRSLGFRQVRVRHHENIARIEVASNELSAMFDIERMASIVAKLKNLGFAYVTLDMLGYRTGSMNEVIDVKAGY